MHMQEERRRVRTMLINEENYVDKAEQTICNLVKKSQEKRRKRGEDNLVTTSKIRNLLSITADIYNQILNDTGEQLSDEICERIQYLRVRFVYEAGREEKVRDFVEEAKILEIIQQIQGSRRNYILFSRYMEALVAFHKYYEKKI